MRRSPFFLLSLLVALATGWSTPAAAKRCRDLKPGDQAACKAAVRQKCSSITGYWPKRRCEERVATGYDSCAKPATLKACKMVNRARKTICDVVGSRMNYKTMDAWHKAVKEFPALVKRLKRVRPLLKGCDWKVDCSGPRRCKCMCDHAFGQCWRARRDGRKYWREFVVSYKSTVDIRLNWIKQNENGKQWLDAASRARKLVKLIQKVINMNRGPVLTAQKFKTDDRVLAALIPGLLKRAATNEQRHKRELAKRRCPRGRGSRSFRKLAKRYFANANAKADERVVRFVLHGRKTRTYHVHLGVLRAIVNEHQQGIACVRRKFKATGKKDCFYIYINFRRRKFRRARKWGPWKVRNLSHFTEVLCKRAPR
jgi:hypothetical protein